MSTVPHFHPDLREIAGNLGPPADFSAETLPGIREAIAGLGDRGASDIATVPLGDGVSVRVHKPATLATPAPALLWIHGGCYVIGTAAQDDRVCRSFAQRLGAVVASVDYRLAPEHPYPAAVDDCVAALQWLAAQPEVDSSRIAIGGASAGGGLTAALALRMREHPEIRPVMQLLVYPMLDDRPAEQSDPAPERRRLMGQGMNRFGWRSYLRGADPDEAVPARASSLADLPQAWIGVGTHDLLFDENRHYAERLRRDGVPCTLEIVEGSFHGFDLIAPDAEVSRRFFESQCEALRGALAAAS